ncbi:hypothetical protein F5Y17DRAFT_478448 [Xylariaceae sp. FL0594]|nr:hypothetical protein F5Y17DRAFT_478448 [Xylariaceae sp. FL0594]
MSPSRFAKLGSNYWIARVTLETATGLPPAHSGGASAYRDQAKQQGLKERKAGGQTNKSPSEHLTKAGRERSLVTRARKAHPLREPGHAPALAVVATRRDKDMPKAWSLNKLPSRTVQCNILSRIGRRIRLRLNRFLDDRQQGNDPTQGLLELDVGLYTRLALAAFPMCRVHTFHGTRINGSVAANRKAFQPWYSKLPNNSTVATNLPVGAGAAVNEGHWATSSCHVLSPENWPSGAPGLAARYGNAVALHVATRLYADNFLPQSRCDPLRARHLA